jgi:hypothetical protein
MNYRAIYEAHGGQLILGVVRPSVDKEEHRSPDLPSDHKVQLDWCRHAVILKFILPLAEI